MPSVQTSYGARQIAAVAGQPASSKRFDADTRITETEAGIGFGLAVSQGTAARGCILGGADFIGITYKDITLVIGNADKYIEGNNSAVMHKGDVWVVASGAVAIGDPVRYNATTGALGAGAGTTIANARWMTAGANGEPVLVRLGEQGGASDTGAAPVNSVAPAITGTAQDGEVLTVADGTWSGTPTFARQWYADDVAIVGETAATYTAVTADVGKVINVIVTATNAAGSASAPSNDTAAVIAA